MQIFSIILTILIIIILVAIFLCLFKIIKVEKYVPTNEGTELINQIRERIRLIDEKFYHIPIKEGKSSFTKNKKTITLCLRDPKTSQLYDINIMMYVTLHELAHTITQSYGHDDAFKDNFSQLLEKAINLRIYDPTYPVPKNYCK